jgi:hypothetical protein
MLDVQIKMIRKIFTIEHCKELGDGFVCLLPGIPDSKIASLDHSMTIEVRCASGQIRKDIPFIIPSAESYEHYPQIGLIIPPPYSFEDFSPGSEVWATICDASCFVGKSNTSFPDWALT